MRAPGMTMFKMPVFSWASLCANILIIASFPILTVTIALLTLDRYLGTHFFTNDMGGNMMMYINLIWAWGHPEVYILVLPVFGVFSEIAATFSRKRLFGYTSLVWATRLYYRSVVHRLAAPLLHHGCWRERKRLLRYYYHDYRDPDRG